MPSSISEIKSKDGGKGFSTNFVETTGRGMRFLLALLIVLVTVCVYAQTRKFAFISYDDPIYTTDNQMVQKGLTLDGVVWAFTDATEHTNYWAPLTWITFLIDYELYGLDSGGYHLTNLLFHVLNSVLLFSAFYRLTGRMWAPFFLSLFFAVHPLHVESVAWISERKDMVSTFFWFLTIRAYVGYVRKPGIASYSAVFLFFLASLMSKPMGVTLPFVLLLFDYWPLCRFGRGRPVQEKAFWQTCRRLLREKIPMFIVIVIIIPLTYYTQSKSGAVKSIADISVFFRIENVAVAYVSNILKTFWPVNLGMLYPYPASLPSWQPITAVTLLSAVTGLMLKLFVRYPYLPVGWLWYLGTFVPVAGFIVIGPHVTADRYTYIPLIGLFIMVIWGGSDLTAGIRLREKIACGIAVAAVCTFAWLAHKQVGHWENGVKIYAQTLHVTKDNWPTHLNIGAAYRKINQNGAALEHYRKAVRIKPNVPELQLSVGEVLIDMGKIAAAANHYENALEILPDSAAIHTALAVALDRSGSVERALVHFQKALAIDESFADAHHGLGVTQFQQGQVDLAIGHYRKTLRIDADHAPAHYNLGVALFSIGDSKRARESFQAAISADPEYADPQYALGVLYLKAGEKYAAFSHFKRALEISPTHKPARQGLQLATDK